MRLLGLGAAIGLAVAAAGLLRSGRPGAHDAADGAVARVNGVAIRADDYQRALAGVADGRREDPDGALRRHVLERLVDEELLVQRGLELGLAQVDPRVRRELAAAVIAAAIAQPGDAPDPTPDQLAAFYAAERGFFARAARVQVQRLDRGRRRRRRGPAGAAADRAAAAAARLRAGDEVATVRAAVGDPEPTPLPDALLPPAKLADYLGSSALRSALTLPVGGVSAPLRTSGGQAVLMVVARETGEPPPLETIGDEVRAEWKRRAGERALRAYLDGLRARADVQVAAAP
ncbi:MAG: SurA N-terminal domain-containing protein [bacterium]|nr:SurA N-terminal domain-containing protein [bacterium]